MKKSTYLPAEEAKSQAERLANMLPTLPERNQRMAKDLLQFYERRQKLTPDQSIVIDRLVRDNYR